MSRWRWLFVLCALLLVVSVAYASVDILNFQAIWQGNQVNLSWQTGNELDHTGFHVWRSEENLPIVNGKIDFTRSVRLSPSMIRNPATACTSSGSSYTFQDRNVIDTDQRFYYYLESYNCNNSETVFMGEDGSGWQVERRPTLFLPLLTTPN